MHKEDAWTHHFTHLYLHVSGLEVESNLKLEMVHDGSEDLHPVLLQWCVAMLGDWDLADLSTPSL